MMRAQSRRAARNLATSSSRSLWALKKKLSRGREAVHGQAALHRRLDVGDGVGQGEGDLLDGRAAGLADVVAGDADGVPVGHVLRCSTRRCR